jgi:hypothetical protein
MRDPERLLQRPPSDFTAKLLRAGAEEKPSSAALRRTLKVAAVGTAIGASLQATSASAAALGAKSSLAGMGGGAVASGVAGGAAGAGVAAAASAAAAGNGVAALTVVAIAKWVGVGAVGGVMAATAAHRLAPGSLSAVGGARATASAWSASAPPRPAAPAALPRAARVRDPGVSASFADATATDEPASGPSTAAFAVEAPRGLEASKPALPSRGAALLAQPATPTRPAASQSGARSASAPVLAAEVAMVDRGRAALQRGDGAGALQALAGYEAAFPKQQLSPEVLFLRMEALARMGNLSQARALAQRIVARGATGPQAMRARELLGQ